MATFGERAECVLPARTRYLHPPWSCYKAVIINRPIIAAIAQP
ncbi:hypothetical protein AWB68_08884 [Caballeronia choica]|uniref:Uncharacterized protein n=2 Tax=Caballeronia choica TaxID=326476 RepID=A0A158L774_9BURK|nr:hypothetical protein AWB68_08884 [Caballeronia choica]